MPMHKTQLTYATAKALVATLEADYARCRPVLAEDADDAAFEAWCDATEKMRSEMGIYIAKDALAKAEHDLIAWATTLPALKKMAAGKLDLGSLVRQARKSLVQWEKLVDICFRASGK